MNIFVLEREPERCAQAACDRHVVKMPLETAQMLCTAHRYIGGSTELLDRLYKPTHPNHPCTKWVRASSGNYAWAFQLFLAQLDEYAHRYGRVHGCARLIPDLAEAPASISRGCMTDWPQAMPDEYRCGDAVDAYRSYYLGAKASFAVWERNRPAPAWWVSSVSERVEQGLRR